MEFKRLIDTINPLVKGQGKEPTDLRRQIFDEIPHLGMDNHFSGDATSKYVGDMGFKSTLTCRRDRFPAGVPKKYFHSLKECKVDSRSRVARFENPIIAVKHGVSTTDGFSSQVKHVCTRPTHMVWPSTLILRTT